MSAYVALENSTCELGESPVWDSRVKHLYWVDVLAGKIFCSNLKDKPHLLATLEISIGAVALTENVDELLLATEEGFCLLNLETSLLTKLKDPEKDLPSNRFNDGKCDPEGRFWAGTMAKDGRGNTGSLYCFDNDQQIQTKLTGVNCSNGLAWNKAQDKMYYIDTGRGCIDVFDYNSESAEISQRRTILSIEKSKGLPDGMSIDEEDKIWVALWGGNSVIRVDPETGSILDRVELPVSQVTSCTFGGEDLETLFITTANIGLSEEEKTKEPLAGQLFSCEVGVKGRATNFYKRKAEACA